MKIIKEVTKIYGLEDLTTIVNELYALKDHCSVYTFTGDLGAGKTTLVKALLKKFGVQDIVTSPTFGYVNTYHNHNHEMLHHFDLYRLINPEEFLQLGFDEYLYVQKSWSFIEWPEIIESLLHHNVCKIQLDYESSLEQRIIVYKVIE